MVADSQIEDALSTLFPQDSGENSANPDPESIDQGCSIYPEQLLHATEKGNKYYVAFQSLTRQFYDDDKNGTSAGSIAHFNQSRMSALSRKKVLFWDDKEHDNEVSDFKSDPKLAPVPRSENTAASSLFAWSSGDKYIAARKRELQRKTMANSGSAKSNTASPEPYSNGLTKKDIPTKSAELKSADNNSTKKPKGLNFTHRLTTVVENESNRFIKDRIRLIKDHHVQQAAKKIDERRKRDHEMQLRRVQLKEEKYENIIKAAIAVQNTKRNSGFFGSLFGSKPISNSFTLEITDAEVRMRPTTPSTSKTSKSTDPDPSVPSLDNGISVEGPESVDTDTDSDIAATSNPPKSLELHQDRSPLSQAPAIISSTSRTGTGTGTKSSSSSSSSPSPSQSSFEFEAYQSSTNKTAMSNMDTVPGAGPLWNTKHQFEENPLHTQENLSDGSFSDFETAPALQSQAHRSSQDLLSL